MMMRGRSAAVRQRSASLDRAAAETAITMLAGPSATATSRERDRETRDTFTRHVHLPRGPERELVRDRDREYTLRGSESRTLATVGAFRVVSSRDLRDHDDQPGRPTLRRPAAPS